MSNSLAQQPEQQLPTKNNHPSEKQSNPTPSFQSEMNSPQARITSKLRMVPDQSFQARMTTQLRSMPAEKEIEEEEEKAPIQGKFIDDSHVSDSSEANNTGLPNQLKTGIENLSGYAIDDVKVHYDSDQPAQLQAHAYAQGTDIHIAPGQEKYLPHEAWHVVQQKQGRVQATTQLKQQVPINDDSLLEREADIMGQKALQTNTLASQLASKTTTSSIVQRGKKKEDPTPPVDANFSLGNFLFATKHGGGKIGSLYFRSGDSYYRIRLCHVDGPAIPAPKESYQYFIRDKDYSFEYFGRRRLSETDPIPVKNVTRWATEQKAKTKYTKGRYLFEFFGPILNYRGKEYYSNGYHASRGMVAKPNITQRDINVIYEAINGGADNNTLMQTILTESLSAVLHQ